MKPALSSRPRSVSLLSLSLCLILGSIAGCGDESSRMAGTIDVPERSVSRPDLKQAAAEAKAKAKAAKTAKSSAPAQ